MEYHPTMQKTKAIHAKPGLRLADPLWPKEVGRERTNPLRPHSRQIQSQARWIESDASQGAAGSCSGQSSGQSTDTTLSGERVMSSISNWVGGTYLRSLWKSSSSASLHGHACSCIITFQFKSVAKHSMCLLVKLMKRIAV